MVSSEQLRYNYALIKKRYAKRGKKIVRLTQSSLLLVQAIDATTNVYKFPVLETDNAVAPLPEEIRLNTNDEFISYDLGYYLMANKVAVQVEETPIVPLLNAKMFFTYAPDELGVPYGNLQDAWLGKLEILVNKISRLEKWDLKRHNVIPRTQFRNSLRGIPIATQPSADYKKDGMFEMSPMLTLSGAKKNEVTVTLVHAVPSTVTGTWANPDGNAIRFDAKWLALLFRGMLAQNAAKFQ